MKIKLLHQISLTANEKICTATLASKDDVLLLTDTGSVSRYSLKDQHRQELFSVKSSIVYADGGFDVNEASTIYSLDDIVVVVNSYGRHGFVHYPGKYSRLHLWRGEYCAEISFYPIALYKNGEGVPHIIYAEDWNHIQIMNLDTRQILTAAKSLIVENAEEDHLAFYKTHEEANLLPWPSKYDYFFGKLQVSPDSCKFLSLGWVWGSYDMYTAFDINHFITSNRIADIPIAGGEHSNRAACWVDSYTVAIAYNPFEEGDEGATKDSPHEINFYTIANGKTCLTKKVCVSGLAIVNSDFIFSNQLNAIVILSKEIGVAVVGLDGKVMFHDSSVKANSYNPDTNMLLTVVDGCRVDLHQLIF